MEIKKPPTKEELRRELERQVRAYVESGGAVEEVARGVSGREGADAPLKAFRQWSEKPREERTYLTDVVAAIEARRRPVKSPASRRSRPRRKPVLDDFGEPVRWVWVEDE